jgi:hypothetical protein
MRVEMLEAGFIPSEIRFRPACAEKDFAGSVFSNQFLQLPAPQGHKGPARSRPIDGRIFRKSRMLTAQITKFYLATAYPGIVFQKPLFPGY